MTWRNTQGPGWVEVPPPVIEDDPNPSMKLSLWLQDAGVDQGWSTLTWWTEIEAMSIIAQERAERHVAAGADVALEGFDG